MDGLRSAAPRPPPAVVPVPEERPSAERRAPGVSFNEALAQATAAASGVRFSKHALARLDRRQIALTPERLRRLEEAVARADAKGARDSLVLLDDLALVVSIRQQTVVTATAAHSRRGGVFTNIDSAVIA